MGQFVIDGLTKRYQGTDEGDILAVDNVSLEFMDGEFITIVGPSGSGKSTLLRTIAGLETATEGTIKIGEEIINDVPPQDRDVAMVFQNYALYPHMTARKNMSYGLQLMSDLSDEEIDERVEEAAEMMGITDQLNKKPDSLSGGQQQRVATGRAIVRDPEVFLMDEPLSNLDAKLRTRMRTELQRIQDELGTTTIYVTHDQEEAMTMSDRVVVLHRGVIQQVDPPEKIYNEPANLFVADFIGSPSMNMFSVELQDQVLISEEFEYHPSDEQIDTIHQHVDDGAQLKLGIRPEDIELVDEEGENTIQSRIDVREPIGSDNYLYITLGGEDCTVRCPGHIRPNEGEKVIVRLPSSRVHLFHPDSGRNILVSDEGEETETSDTVRDSMAV